MIASYLSAYLQVVKGDLPMWGLKPQDVVLSDKPKKFSAQLEGWVLEVRAKPKPLQLIFVKQSVAQKWLQEIQKQLAK